MVGIAFYDIGSKNALLQMSFIFMMLQMASMSAMQAAHKQAKKALRLARPRILILIRMHSAYNLC